MTRQSLEADMDEILRQFEHWIKQPHSTLYRHHDFLRTEQALLMTVDRYVEEQERLAVADELNHWAQYFKDPSMNLLSPSERLEKRISALRQQVKGGAA